QAGRAGRLYGIGEAAEKRLITRLPLLTVVASALLLLSACGGHKNASAKHVPPPPTVAPAPAPPSASTAKAAPQPEITVPPKTKPIYVETGLASWYGPLYHNHKGSNGEVYDQNALTAAHGTIPLNSAVRGPNEA